MKLKPVVASLVVLGLMTPAFAKSSVASQQAVIDQNSVLTPVCQEGWFNRISFGGVADIMGVMGNHTPSGAYTDVGSSSDLYINNLNLLVNANLSNWSKASVNLAYLGAPIPWGKINSGVTAKDRVIKHGIVADEAYVTLGNLAKYPFYVTVGKKYLPFGDYSKPYAPYHIMSPAQMLAETNAVTVIAGVTTDFGFYGNLFAFRGETYPNSSTSGNLRNFGGKIGYQDHLGAFNLSEAKVNFALGYLHNLWDSQMFGPNVDNSWSWGSGSGAKKTNYPDGVDRSDRAGGISAHFDLAYQAFTLCANWVGAIQNMVQSSYAATSSKLWGADVNAQYAFKTLGRDSSLHAGAQFAGNGKWLGNNTKVLAGSVTDWANMVPNWRVLGGYNYNLFKNTDLNFTVAYGKSFDFGDNMQSARNSTIGLLNLRFVF